MKSLIVLSLLISVSASASFDLETQKIHTVEIINSNQASIDQAVNNLRDIQIKLRRSINPIAALQGVENTCADTDFERLIINLGKKWKYDFVLMTTIRLESKYNMYKKNPDLVPNLSLSKSEIFDKDAKVALAKNIKICNYSEFFNFETSADFDYAVNSAWQNYKPLLSYNDINLGSYQKTMKHIVDNAPVRVQGVLRRLGSGSSSYIFGKVHQVITYDRVFSGASNFDHADLTNPIDIIKNAKKY